MTEPVLTVRGVRKTFEAELAPVRALRGVDLDVAAGELVAIMGPSGCGKTTLLNLVAGLDLADEGTIVIAGEEITGRDEDWLARMRRRHIGIVFQFFNLLEGMTALENVLLPAMIAGNTIVLKPSEITPFTSLYAVDLMYKAGIPKDVIQVVTGDGRTGAALVDYVDFISFTGSTATGRKIAVQAAERLIPVSLELGGKDPLIILNDADLDIKQTAALVERALCFPGDRTREVRAALGELVSYAEFELLNHPRVKDADGFLEALEPLRARL